MLEEYGDEINSFFLHIMEPVVKRIGLEPKEDDDFKTGYDWELMSFIFNFVSFCDDETVNIFLGLINHCNLTVSQVVPRGDPDRSSSARLPARCRLRAQAVSRSHIYWTTG